MRLVSLVVALFILVSPAAAQTVEELEAELAAEREINQLLKQRIETLEAELAGREIAAGERVALPHGTTLTVEREVCDKLFFILDGSAAMSLNGQHTTTIHRGGFVNTLAVQTSAASAESVNCRKLSSCCVTFRPPAPASTGCTPAPDAVR